MSKTGVADVAAQVQQFWAPLFMKELRAKLLLGSLVNRDYEGDIRKKGDTVKVSQINKGVGQTKDVGVDADTFDTKKLSTTQVEIKADKRFVSAYEFEDLVEIQSQIGNETSEIRATMMFEMEEQINDFLYSKVAPSTSTPDHDRTGITNFNAGEVTTLRKLASQAKWMRNKPWWILADPSYMKDMLDDQVLTSQDFVDDRPVIGGQIIQKRFGWNIVEDDSRPEDFAIAFHPDWLYFVTQTQPTFKISDLHSNKQFGFVISVDLIGGAILGIQGDVKHIRITG